MPTLRFPEFSDEWQTAHLGDVATFKNGKPFEDFVHPSGSYNLITIDSVDIEGNLKRKFKKVTETDDSLQKGDIVTVLSDIAHGELLGLTSLIPSDDQYVLNQRMGRLRPKDGVEAAFLSHYINTKQSFFRKRGQGTSQRHIYEKDINELPVALPGSNEQQKIAGFLTAIDQKIEAIDRKIELLKRYKKGTARRLFTQQTRFNNNGGGAYPDWQTVALGTAIQKSSRKNKDLACKNVQSVSNSHGFVNQTEYFNNHSVASKDLSNYYVIEKGMFAYNPSRIDVGSLAYKSDNETSVVSPLYVCFRAKNTILMDDFLLHWFSTATFAKQMTSSFEGSVRNTLNYESLSNMQIALPSIDEQQKIADFLVALDNKITIEQTKLARSKTFKKALLQRMFV